MLGIALIVFVYFTFIKTEPTVISGFNWTEGVIKVKINSDLFEVQPNNMFSKTISVKGELIVSFFDSDNKPIRENRYLVGSKTTVILENISTEDNQCIVEADVSNIYYEVSEESLVTNFTILNDKKPSSSFFINTDHDLKFYVYPGRYTKDQLPEILPKEEKILGLFFIDCENINSNETLTSDILGSIFYDSE